METETRRMEAGVPDDVDTLPGPCAGIEAPPPDTAARAAVSSAQRNGGAAAGAGGALADRTEIKYLVDRSTRTGLERDLLAFVRADVHASARGDYLVRSLYFDSPDFSAYHSKLAGEAVRHKLRARVYGDPSAAPCVRLEVKSRVLSVIHKTSADLQRTDWEAFERGLHRRTLPPADILERPGVREFVRLQRLVGMEPRILIQYRRRAFERHELGRIRVNFDDELVATRHLDLLGPLRHARGLLGYGRAIFEIKIDGGMPFWLHRLITKYELQNQALSKYCLAVRSQARLSAVGRHED